MPTIEVMPITTPSTVSAERILLPRTVSNAIATTSLISPTRIAISRPSFLSQRLDRIEGGGAHRRIQAEDQADQRGDADAEPDRPHFDRRRDRRKRGDGDGDRGAQHGAEH